MVLRVEPALIRFALLFLALYVALGVASPFFPRFLSLRGLTAEEIATVLASGTAIRLLAGPAAGRLADRFHALRIVLYACIALAAIAAMTLATAHGFGPLLWLGLWYSAMLAPTTSLSDALALAAATKRGLGIRFEYGWVRGAGSAAFILGTIASGQVVNALGPAASLGMQSVLLTAAAMAARFVPEAAPPKPDPEGRVSIPAGVGDLVRIGQFRVVVVVAALILGSHAMHDVFLMIVWSQIGISAGTSAILWAESVTAEVLVFFWLGPLLLRHAVPRTGMAIAGAAAVLRWGLTSRVDSVAAFAVIEPLHGLTFALLHLSCMRVIAAVVPRELAATAQAAYGLVIGAMTAALTLASGWLYARFGSAGFWGMAAFAAAALPFIWRMRRA